MACTELASEGVSSSPARDRWPLPCPMARIARPWQAFTGRQARADTKLLACCRPPLSGRSSGAVPRLPALMALQELALRVLAVTPPWDPPEAWEGTAAPGLHTPAW